MTAVYHKEWQVRFADTDPAGIVFYPRYFEMVNGLVEDWFEDRLGWSFREQLLEEKVGTPTVHLEADFLRPSILGDRLTLSLAVLALGATSCTISVTGTCGDEKRFTVKAVLVLVETINYRAVSFPPKVHDAISDYVVKNDEDQ